jgi:hypothetical protein
MNRVRIKTLITFVNAAEQNTQDLLAPKLIIIFLPSSRLNAKISTMTSMEPLLEAIAAFRLQDQEPTFDEANARAEQFLYPREGGCTYQDRHYTEHALERMAPATDENMKLLLSRAFARMQSNWLELEKPRRERPKADAAGLAPEPWWRQYRPQPRGVLPSVVESEIQNCGTTDFEVKTCDFGSVITVIPRRAPSYSREVAKAIEQQMFEEANRIERDFPLFSKVNWVGKRLEVIQGVRPQPIRQVTRRPTGRVIEFDRKFKDWETRIEESKMPSKKVDIAAWKAEQKAKRTVESLSDTKVKKASADAIKIAENSPIRKVQEEPHDSPDVESRGDSPTVQNDLVPACWEELEN